jgi:hypothetical protein
LIVIVYFFAGIAKLNSDWLIEAQPLSIWISSKYDFPIFGNYIFQKKITHYLMSWGGMLYDLSIPFLLLSKRLRWFGFFFGYYISFIHSIFISNWNVSVHNDFICPDFFLR